MYIYAHICLKVVESIFECTCAFKIAKSQDKPISSQTESCVLTQEKYFKEFHQYNVNRQVLSQPITLIS